MSVSAALSALSVFGAAGTSWVKSGTATGGKTRRTSIQIFLHVLICTTYSYSYLLVCLSDTGSSSPHACSTSLSRAGMWEVTPNSLTFSSSWTKFSFFLFCVSAIAGAWRPELSVFPRAFRARGCGGERVTLLFGRARLCGPADIDTTMSVWLLERSDHSEKQRTLLLGLA